MDHVARTLQLSSKLGQQLEKKYEGFLIYIFFLELEDNEIVHFYWLFI